MAEKPTYEALEQRIRELEQAESERRRIEAAFDDQQLLFKKVIDELPFWISLKDEKGRYLFVNEEMAEAHGVDAADFMNRVTAGTPELYPGGLDKMVERDKYVLKHGRRMEIPDYPVLTGDGLRFRRLVKIPWKKDNGDVVGVISWSEDITDRKRVTGLLKENQEFYRSLFESNKSVMLLIDPDSSDIFDANVSACAYYGYSKETLLRMKISDINILSEKEVREAMEKAKAEKKNFFNFHHRLSDGTIRDVEVFSSPIKVGGKFLLCSIVHDISERKQIEKEKERLIYKLHKALSEVKTLRGFLPICASCKKIRDDKGYWNQIESYIRKHSEAEFSHGICPDCAKKIYPNIDISD